MKSTIRVCAILLAAMPLYTSAAVGISPAAIKEVMPQNSEKDGILTFMRSDADIDSAMRIHVYSLDGSATFDKFTYDMVPGDKQIEIAYRVNTHGRELGLQTGYIYIEPERTDEKRVSGNTVIVRAGVRVDLEVSRENKARELSVLDRFLFNAKLNTTEWKGNAAVRLQGLVSTLGE